MNWTVPGSIPWLLAHEMRLNWRTFRAGRAGRGARGLVGMVILGLVMVLGGVFIALGVHGRQIPINPLSVSLAALACAVVFTLMLSQTLSASSEALYDRGDLDLLFSAPIGPGKVLFVRALGVAASVGTIFFLAAAPLLGPSIVWGHPGWLGVFGVLAALALAAAGAGLILAMALFALIGPRRTRTVAQVLAALVGAAFFLASQARTILGEQTSSSLYADIVARAQAGRLHPGPLVDLPLRAMTGQLLPLLAMLLAAVGLFAVAALALGRRFSDAAAAAQGAGSVRPLRGEGTSRRAFAAGAFLATLRKELLLIRRDAALLSQVLLRVLYLVPTALVLSRTASHGGEAALAAGAGVVAFLAGQVAGSLAWITLSAEETPDLLMVSPAPIRVLRRAKLAAALVPVAFFLLIPIAVLTWAAPMAAFWTALGALAASVASGLINVWHQRPGKRSDFKRRAGASWMATLAEIVVSALIALATGVAVAGFAPWGLIPLAVAGIVLLLLRRSDAQIARNLRTR